jgi:O-antigen ligase
VKTILAHLKEIISCYIVLYFIGCIGTLLVYCSIYFIFFIPLVLPSMELLAMLSRGVVLFALLITIMYVSSPTYKEAIQERLDQ